MKLKTLLSLLLLFALTGGVVESAEWTIPDCDRVVGTKAITFTTDEGLTLAETGTLIQPNYTYALAALDIPNTLVAAFWFDNEAAVWRSEDAGCSWQRLFDIPGCEVLTFTAGPGGTIYAWTPGSTDFYRIEGRTYTALRSNHRIYGLAVDPEDAMHLRIGSTDCQIYESRNGGKGFSRVGEAVNTYAGVLFTVDFDPQNWDCALCGTKGAYRTTDGGENWTNVVPFDFADIDLVYRFVYSPVDSRRVWARAKLETMGDRKSGIFLSDDGGANFSQVVAESTLVRDQHGTERIVLMTNMPTMAAHPVNRDVLYFAYGNAYPSWDNYGTDLYRYEMATDNLSLVHNDVLDGINAIAFNPVDPSVMYLGLEQTIFGLTETATDTNQPKGSPLISVAPNPFNPVTTVALNLPQAAQVRVEVYNLIGQKVGTVVNTYLAAGEHAYTWNGSELASGMYLLRVQTGTEVQTRKLVLLK